MPSMEPELAAEVEWKESSVQFNKEMVVNIDQSYRVRVAGAVFNRPDVR